MGSSAPPGFFEEHGGRGQSDVAIPQLDRTSEVQELCAAADAKDGRQLDRIVASGFGNDDDAVVELSRCSLSTSSSSPVTAFFSDDIKLPIKNDVEPQ